MSTLYLCGAGNSEGVRLALTVNRVHRRWSRIVLVDDDPTRQGQMMLGIPIVGGTADLAQASPADEMVNMVARTCERREAFDRKIAAYGVPYASLVHPSVDIDGATLGEGVAVYGGATIGPESVVGPGTVVFMGAVVGHEARVGRTCVLAANAVLNARVTLGDRVYVGSNATIVPEVTIGTGATIGVGSAVLATVPAGATALGVPAEILTARVAPATSHPTTLLHSPSPAEIEVRRAIASIWCELLHVDHVGDDENFFDVGGSSLLACHIAERIRHVTGREVRLVDVFRFPTVRALAQHLGQNGEGADVNSPGRMRAEIRRRMHERMHH